jgi:NADPH-dependent 2,4-dienoyl-CoA reductase/sulfur reductase-like enzyme
LRLSAVKVYKAAASNQPIDSGGPICDFSGTVDCAPGDGTGDGMTVGSTSVAIIGAGPYGLSVAAHLRALGIPHRIFGEPMRFWRELGRGRFLKSFGFATNVYAPRPGLSFTEYCNARGLEGYEPCGIPDFARYGIWAQEQVVPEVEPVDVEHVVREPDGQFRLSLANGEDLRAKRVVVAVGLKPFIRMPGELAALPKSLAVHTSDLNDFEPLCGKDVCVIGAGQSALEVAAMLLDAGANCQLIVRGATAHIAPRLPSRRSLWQRLRAPQSGLGPGLKSWFIERFPSAVHYAPDRWRVKFARTHLGPSGAWWLHDRLEGRLPIHLRCRILQAEVRGKRAALKLTQEGKGERDVEVDLVVAGVGYEVDVDRLTFLDADLRGLVRRLERAPRLDRHFQASVPGLHFVGPSAVMSFGPLFRFIAGAAYAAPALARHLARQGLRTGLPAPRNLAAQVAARPDP